MLIPYKFSPRGYQVPLLQAIDNGSKRAFCLWHRRCGKDKVLWNMIIKKAFEKVAIYYYFFPSYTQAKKVIWDGIDNDGFAFLAHIPESEIKEKNTQELKVKLKNGSIIQLIGTDKYDAVRGTNPYGCVFSEYAFHNPMAWEVVRPILAANGGWAVFNTTPNGKNHAFDLWEHAESNDKWYTQRLTVRDTNVVADDVLDDERSSMSREMFEQEYYCSFDVGAIGSIYGEQLEKMYIDKRVTQLPFQTDVALYVSSDLGVRDSTTLWFWQKIGEFWHCVHYYEGHGKQIDHYLRYIDDYISHKGATMAKLGLPHDSKKRSLTSTKSVLQLAQEHFGTHKVEYLKIGSRQERIDTVRREFARIKIDADTCAQGLKALENYQYKYNEVLKSFSKDPLHNWASDGADGFGYGVILLLLNCVVKKEKLNKPSPLQKRAKATNRLFMGSDSVKMYA